MLLSCSWHLGFDLVCLHSQWVTSVFTSFVFLLFTQYTICTVGSSFFRGQLCASPSLVISHYLFICPNITLIPEPDTGPSLAISLFGFVIVFVCPSVQVNFVACQLFALLMAVWFRLYLHPSKTSPFIRHVVATLLGFYLALFCFGWWVTALFVTLSSLLFYTPALTYLPSFLPQNFFQQYYICEIFFSWRLWPCPNFMLLWLQYCKLLDSLKGYC